MSISTYDLLAQALFLGAVVALAVAVAYLIALFIGWNSHNRKSRFVRFFLVFLLSCPALLGAQQYVQWRIVMPLLREAKTREVIQHRCEQIKTTSYLSVGDVVPTFDITDANGFPFLLSPLAVRRKINDRVHIQHDHLRINNRARFCVRCDGRHSILRVGYCGMNAMLKGQLAALK